MPLRSLRLAVGENDQTIFSLGMKVRQRQTSLIPQRRLQLCIVEADALRPLRSGC